MSRPKAYDLSHGEGLRLWDACRAHASALAAAVIGDTPLAAAPDSTAADSAAPHDRHGAGQLIRPRLGQSAFRLAVTEAYARSCAATGEHSLPVLDAAHILPWAVISASMAGHVGGAAARGRGSTRLFLTDFVRTRTGSGSQPILQSLVRRRALW